jgi:hypothetical protein
VVFRTDLENGKRYPDTLFWEGLKHHWKDGKGVVNHILDYEAFTIEGTNLLHSIGMVAEVIKPTKERMYSEEEVRKAIDAAESVMINVQDTRWKKGMCEAIQIITRELIKSLNK